jgi:hypothetical protein
MGPVLRKSGAADHGTQAAVRQAGDFGFGSGVGSGRLSLIGAAEGAAAELDALDWQTLPAKCEGGAATLAMSARQMDRRLQSRKREQKRKIYGRTKPGALLKHQIAIKTDSWEVKAPGFTAVDLVLAARSSASCLRKCTGRPTRPRASMKCWFGLSWLIAIVFTFSFVDGAVSVSAYEERSTLSTRRISQ